MSVTHIHHLGWRTRAKERETIGIGFILFLVYAFMEYGRPANPMHIPMVLSIIMFLLWLRDPKKHWNPQILCFFAMLLVILFMGPFATNQYAIFWGFVQMAVQLLCVCIPMIHFINRDSNLELFVKVLVGLYAYIGLVAILNGGRGPGGYIQDENDVALTLNMAIPFAFFSMIRVGGRIHKAMYGCALVLMLLGLISTYSRGGFLGLLPTIAYCLFYAPRKLAASAASFGLVIVMVWYAPTSYWNEMATIAEEKTTADPFAGSGALRLVYWDIAAEMFYANPIFGVGFKNYSFDVETYQPEELTEKAERIYAGQVAHSLYFSLIAELGLAGVAVFLALLWFNYKDTRSVISRGTETLKERGLTSPRERIGRYSIGAVKEDRGRGNDHKVTPEHTRRTMHCVSGAERSTTDRMTMYLCYTHALRASMIAYLVTGIFVSVFEYPHFWILTSLIVVLRNLCFDGEKQVA